MKLSTPPALLVAALIQATSAGAAPGYDGRNGRAFITARSGLRADESC